MGFFSFLKKKNESMFPEIEPLKLDLGKHPMETVRPSPAAPLTPEVPSFEPSFNLPSPPPLFKEGPREMSRDIELLSSKLDTIKAMLENLGHRLERLEQQQQAKEKTERLRW